MTASAAQPKFFKSFALLIHFDVANGKFQPFMRTLDYKSNIGNVS